MAAPAKRSMAAGELSPTMHARADLSRYQEGLATLRNATVLRTGGVQSRPGTEYGGSTKGNAAVRLVPAVFDTDESYVLEFGDGYLRVWEDNALVEVGSPSAWATSTVYAVGNIVANDGVNYYCILAHTSGSTTEPGTGASWETNWYALTGDIFEMPTDYTAAQLDALQFAYQYRVVTIVHPSHPPATLTKGATDTAWVLADIDFAQGGAVPSSFAVSGATGSGWGYAVAAFYAAGSPGGIYGPATDFIYTDTTSASNTFAYSLARAADPRTITWVAPAGHTTDAYILYLRNGTSGTIYAIAVTGTSYVDNGTGFYGATSTTPYVEASDFFDASGEYPGVVGAYQQRLLLAGTDDEPDVVRASQVASPYNFYASDPIVDSDSLSWRQVGRRLNRIRHFTEVAQQLVQFSDVGESIVQGDVDGILRPGEVNPRQFSENGSASISPLVVNDTALYVQARGGIVRDIAPSGVGGFAGSDLTLQAAHLVDGYTIVDWCYQQTPNSVVWAVRDDGTLLSLTYVRELGILGWATHDTDGSYERVCCIPENGRDAVYVVVNRTIDGNTVRYVERFADRLADTPVLMDAAVTATTSATSGPRIVPQGFGTWTKRGTTLDSRYLAVAASADEVVGLAQGEWANPIIRTTDGTAWATVNAATSDYSWYDLTRAEALGLFIAVGTGDSTDADNVVMTSTTGEVWTLQTAGFTDDDSAGCVVFAPAIPLVIISDLDGSDVLTSADGVAYTESAATGLAGSGMVGMAAHPTNPLVIGCDGVAVYSTANGVAWTAVTLPSFAGSPTLGTDVVYTGTSFVIGVLDDGDGGTGLLTGTADGVTWTYAAFTGDAVGFVPDRLVWNDTDDVLLLMQGTGVGATTDALVTSDFTTFSAVTMQSAQAGRGTWASAFSRFIVPDAGLGSDTTSVQDATYASQLRVTGLDFLEGESVSVANGGTVVASPYNPAYTTLTVSGGTIEIDTEEAYTSLTVGLPFFTDIQTLDLDFPASSRLDSGVNITRLGLWLEDSIAPFASNTAPSGTSVATMNRMLTTDANGTVVTTPMSGYRESGLDGAFTRGGRIFLRQVDPSPLTVLAIIPQGTFGR